MLQFCFQTKSKLMVLAYIDTIFSTMFGPNIYPNKTNIPSGFCGNCIHLSCIETNFDIIY